MLGDILNVFVQKAQQPYGHHYGKQALPASNRAIPRKPKCLAKRFFWVFMGRGQNFILYVSNAFWMI